MIIRECTSEDAERFKQLLETIDAETDFMLYSRNERDMSIHEAEKMIHSFESASSTTIIISEADGELVGYLMAVGGKAKKNKHSAYLAMGVAQAFSGRGIGTRLMAHIEEWARENSISRLELTTMIHNEAALALYKKMGYEVEGVKRKSLKINDAFTDEYYFAKLLHDEQEN